MDREEKKGRRGFVAEKDENIGVSTGNNNNPSLSDCARVRVESKYFLG